MDKLIKKNKRGFIINRKRRFIKINKIRIARKIIKQILQTIASRNKKTKKHIMLTKPSRNKKTKKHIMLTKHSRNKKTKNRIIWKKPLRNNLEKNLTKEQHTLRYSFASLNVLRKEKNSKYKENYNLENDESNLDSSFEKSSTKPSSNLNSGSKNPIESKIEKIDEIIPRINFNSTLEKESNNDENSNQENKKILTNNQSYKYCLHLLFILLQMILIFHTPIINSPFISDQLYLRRLHCNLSHNLNEKVYENMNYLYENYQKDLKNYDQSSELLQKLSNSTDKIKNLLYDDELSEIMTREQKDFLIINKKISRKLSNSLLILKEKVEYETILRYDRIVKNAISKKSFILTTRKLKEISGIAKKFEKELIRSISIVKELSINIDGTYALVQKFNLFNDQKIIGLFILLLLLYILFLCKKVDVRIEIFSIFLIITLIFILILKKENMIKSKITSLHKHLYLSQEYLENLTELNSKLKCSLDEKIKFTEEIIIKIEEQTKIVKGVIIKVKDEVFLNVEIGKERARIRGEKFAHNIEAYTPDSLPKEISLSIDKLNSNIKIIIHETTNYFTMLKSHSESLINAISELKSILIEKRIFKFKEFMNYLISYYKSTISMTKPIIKNITDTIDEIDPILDSSDQANKNNTKNEESTILLKNAGVSSGFVGAAVMAVGLNPIGLSLGIVTGVIGFFGSDNTWSKENYKNIVEINEKFSKFKNKINDIRKSFEEESNNLIKCKSKLENLKGVSKDILNDVSSNFENEDNLLMNVILEEDEDISMIIDSLNDINTKTEEIYNISKMIIDEFFELK